MKNLILSITAIILMGSMLLFLGGCQKDEIINQKMQPVPEHSFQKLKSISQYPNLERYLERSFRSLNLRNSYFQYNDIDTSRIFETVFSNGHTSYAMSIENHKQDNWSYNLVVEKINDNFDNIMIAGIEHLTSNQLILHQIEFEEGFGKNNRNSELESCIREYIESSSTIINCKPPDAAGSGGGSSNGNSNSGNTNGGIPWYDPINFWNPSEGSGTGGTRPPVNVTPLPGGAPKGIKSEGFWDIYFFNQIMYLIWRQFPKSGFAIKDEDKGTRDVSNGCLKKLKFFGLIDANCTPSKDLGEELYNECKSSNPKLKEKIEALENTIINPCTGAKFDVNKLGKILCLEDKYNEGDFDKALDYALASNPHIKISSNLATDCPKLNCILNKLLNDDGPTSDFLCDMMSKFDGSPSFEIGSSIPKTNEPIFSAKALPSPTGNKIGIVFNKNNCNTTDVLDLFETYQHEMVHADFYRQLIEDYNWSGDPMTLDATFKILVAKKYGTNATPDQHILMLNQLLPDMINSLMQANGSSVICTGTETSGPCKYFRSQIINGFSKELLENELGISLTQHALDMATYNLWKLSQPLFTNLNACK